MNTAEISNKIFCLKKSGKTITNCFVNFSPADASEYETISSEKTLIIILREEKVNRVLFYTLDIHDLLELSDRFLTNDEYTMDIITKDPQQFQNELVSNGFHGIAEMMRLANNNVPEVLSADSPVYKYLDNDYGVHAEPSDCDDISNTLWQVFDTRISHLPTKDAIITSIKNDEFLIYRNQENKIASLLQTVAAPKKLYINQVYNSDKPEIVHSMLLNRIRQYCGQGGKYIYSWVDKNNIASIKFHQKYNMTHDGLWDMVYVKNGRS